MEITPIGVLCMACAALAVLRPFRWGLFIFGIFMPLAVAAAINLPGPSLLCRQIIALGLMGAVVIRPRLGALVTRSLLQSPAAVLLLLFTVYASFSAIFMPRLFGGMVDVFTIERAADGSDITALVTLRPNIGNVTQGLYLVSYFVMFAVIYFFATSPQGMRRAGHFLNVVTAVHLIFAGLDFLRLDPFLELFRTANYTVHDTHHIAGIRRVIGSYSEASFFAGAGVTLFAYNFVRFVQTRGVWFFTASALTFVFVLAALSTTGYAALGLLCMVWGLHTMFTLIRGRLGLEQISALIILGVGVSIVAALVFFEPARELGADLFESLFGTKLESHSGKVRGSWNSQSLQNFLDTYGLGVGWGSSRTSGLGFRLIGHVGVIGSLLYLLFLFKSALQSTPKVENTPGSAANQDRLLAPRIFSAARAGALASLFGGLVSGVGGTDEFFILFVAVAAAAHHVATQRVKRTNDIFAQNNMGLLQAQ